MIVQAVKSFAGVNFSMTMGEKRNLSADMAEKYIRIGYVKSLETRQRTVTENETKRNKIK